MVSLNVNGKDYQADVDPRTRSQRRADKEAVAAERRAIKKAARRNLKKQLLDDLAEGS